MIVSQKKAIYARLLALLCRLADARELGTEQLIHVICSAGSLDGQHLGPHSFSGLWPQSQRHEQAVSNVPAP
jgi:hypothetical protein